MILIIQFLQLIHYTYCTDLYSLAYYLYINLPGLNKDILVLLTKDTLTDKFLGTRDGLVVGDAQDLKKEFT